MKDAEQESKNEGLKIAPRCFLCNSEKGTFVHITKDIHICLRN